MNTDAPLRDRQVGKKKSSRLLVVKDQAKPIQKPGRQIKNRLIQRGQAEGQRLNRQAGDRAGKSGRENRMLES